MNTKAKKLSYKLHKNMNLAFRKEPWVTVCAIEPNCGTIRTRQKRSFRAVLDPDFFGLFCSMSTFIWLYKITTHYKIIFDTMCAMFVVLHSRFLLHIFMLNTLLLFSENLTWIIYLFNDYSPVTQQFHNSFYDLWLSTFSEPHFCFDLS